MNNSGILNTNKEQRLLLTTISKIGFFILFIVFGSLVGVSLFVSFNAPRPWEWFTMSSWRCAGADSTFSKNCKGIDLLEKSNKITIQLGPYSIFNQESRLEYYFMKKNTKRDMVVDGTVKFKYTLYGTSVLNQPNQVIDPKKVKKIEDKTIETRVHCKASNMQCETSFISSEIYLDYPIYLIELSVVNENVKDSVADMLFKTTNVTSTYTIFELFWRLVFIIFSCLCTIVYLWANRSIPQEKWSHEQKWTVVLLTFLIWENNPLFPYEFLMDNAFYLFVNSVIDTVFICFLMFYVLIMFDALRKPIKQRMTLKFYVPRALLCGLLFVFILINFMYNKTRKIYSPTMTGSKDPVNIVVSLGIMILLVIYLFWLVFSIIRSFSEVRKLGTTGYRVQVYGLFTIFILLLYVSLLLSVFFMGYRNNAVVSLTTIAFVNFYCMVLAILYLPSSSGDEKKEERARIVKLDDEEMDLKVEGYDDEDQVQEQEKGDEVVIEQ
ncbi:transmembrane protein, putative [Entamoeba invadens IP1]|uniref:Transmembrane protein, putative n=1 Tax=Entamoeba invadens IP1 TaxID=370355 RepID=A0A0A1UDG4_ENTIV|nr:transmembrane protein, putative [Entamoeba invadens IP1]ELP94488.1 transmembrane protein, putative [Entamoeba invadens IP1]|eukprot:XP_004261259.1 transmembrane protein, putative [Entamoeba invadens IP1]